MTRSPASDPSKWGMAQADIMRATKPQPGKDSGGPAHSHASDNSLRRVALPYPDFMPARGSRPRLHRLLDPAQAHRRRQAAPPTALARRSASARAISTRSRHHSPDRREGRRQRHRCVPKDLIRMREDCKTPSQRPLTAIPMRRTPVSPRQCSHPRRPARTCQWSRKAAPDIRRCQ